MAATRDVPDYVRSLGLNAYVVGGAVRDELLGLPAKDADFVVPGVGYEELRAALEPHGRVEDLVVAGRRVGLRLHPRDPQARALAPAGIELAPPRAERSTGPGRHDFEIVADASISLEDDMRRRDFTVNAMARSLDTGELVDPLGGERDLAEGVLRTVGPRSFEEDPLRLVRGLRFVSQLGLEPDADTLRQLHEHAAAVEHVSGERIGGGLQADGLGELSKLLLGREPARALRLARDTGVLAHVLPELAPALGFDQGSRYHDLPLDEHLFRTVQAAADAGAPLAVRLAGLLHDAGKPASAWRGDDGRLHYYASEEHGTRSHEAIGAELAAAALARLRYPTRLAQRVRRIVRAHMFQLHRKPSAVKARRFLARHGESLGADLVAHKRADVSAKRETADAGVREELEQLDRFEELLAQEAGSPFRLDRLAVDGGDLLALGYEPGPRLGSTLDELLHAVVERPELNTRDELLERARRRLAAT